MTTTLTRISWASMIGAFVLVGATSFSEPYGPLRNLVAMVVAYVIAGVTVAVRAATERSTRAKGKLEPIQPFLTAALAITAGWATLTTSGGTFSVLAVSATVAAGANFSLPVGSAITAAGIVALDSIRLAYPVATWNLLGIPVLMLLGFLFGRLIHEYRLRAEQTAVLLANAEQLQQERSRAATLGERNRIAREIHDVLAHSLGSLGLQLQAAQALLTDSGDIERAVEMIGKARRVANEGLEETRRALHALRTDAAPLPDALAVMSEEHRRQYETAVHFEIAGRPRPISPDADVAITRAAKEALVNTAKHAPHRPVDVRLAYGEATTTLTVRNPLPSEPTSEPRLQTADAGYGLAGIRERLLLLKGSLSAGPSGGAWVVTAQVPQ